MIVLGFDPALQNIGWGVISMQGSKANYLAHGTIHTDSKQEMTLRLAHIAAEVEAIIIKYQPKLVAMEEVFVNKNALSSMKLSQARGVIMASIGKFALELREFAPNTVKKTIVGAGKASKEQVAYMVNIMFPAARVTNLDAADAIAVAYTCYAYHKNI